MAKKMHDMRSKGGCYQFIAVLNESNWRLKYLLEYNN
jgi:hypothetical protein